MRRFGFVILIWAFGVSAATRPSVPWSWKKGLDSTRAYVVQLTYFEVPRDKMERFRLLAVVQELTRDLVEAPGIAGFSLHEDVATARYWTMSVWEDSESLDAFTRGTAHASVVASMRGLVREARFVRWETRGLEAATMNWPSMIGRAPCGALVGVMLPELE